MVDGFHYLYHPVTKRLQELLAAGDLGELVRVDTTVVMPDPGADDPRWSLALSGGATMDLGCYALHAQRVLAPWAGGEPVLVSPLHPDRTFARFDDETVMHVARDSMPGVTIRDATWLNEYDDYFYRTVSSFDLGLPRMAKTLPVLRVRYEDAAQTWLYLTPSPGQILKVERLDRANRWGYYGLHAFDFAFLYRYRPLWDIVVVALLVFLRVALHAFGRRQLAFDHANHLAFFR